MLHYMILPGYVPATCHKNNIFTLLVNSMLYYHNITRLQGTVCLLVISINSDAISKQMEDYVCYVCSATFMVND